MLEARDFEKTFALEHGQLKAVDGLSFHVSPGEVYGLMGPNGAGKTTTLRMILGLLEPDAGYAQIDGFRTSEDPDSVKARLGFVSASDGVYPWLSVREMLLYFADLYAVEPAVASERLEMLAELMRLKSNVAVAGTHGKTTTTTMVAALLDHGRFDPTVINGGIIHAYGSNARVGQGEWMVVEADESDGTFNRLPATIAIVTNIDPEHMEHWGTEENLHRGFYDFVSNIPFYGLAVCCTDDADVQALVAKLTDRRVVTYGFNTQADIRAVNLRYEKGVAHFDVALQAEGEVIEGCQLPMPGDHNVSNALSAVAVARHLGMKRDEIREALANFGGVNRRFTRVGEVNGVTVIDDYGHHPTEIAAVLKAARQACEGRVIAVHQPHRYTRLHHHFDEFCACFNEADVVAIAEVYAAGEDPIEGATRDDLVAGLIRAGHRHARAIQDEDDLERLVREQANPGDMVVCLGAGTISTWANGLPERLSRG